MARHGLGAREVFGRLRVHTVTWIDGQVQVEGVEADDYPASRALISRLRRPGRATARTWEEVPAGYEGFEIVEHRREIDAPYSPQCLAVKIREDDLASWALHAWLRSQLPRKLPAGMPPTHRPDTLAQGSPKLPPPPSPDAQAVARALLAHGDALAGQLKDAALAQFTPNRDANQLVHDDPFAFLLAVISDMGIPAERAWALPYQLRKRLGHLDPGRLAADPEAVLAAVRQEPMLHRFVNHVSAWLVQAAQIILDKYHGDAAALWSDTPTAAELRRRLEDFPGIGQKKAAMAVEILARDLGVPLRELSGGDVAYDVHLRRVFLRTGLAQHDKVDHMVAVARALYPERPGALDMPAWDIGRRWCRPTGPDCPDCPINAACPRLIDRAAQVRGVLTLPPRGRIAAMPPPWLRSRLRAGHAPGTPSSGRTVTSHPPKHTQMPSSRHQVMTLSAPYCRKLCAAGRSVSRPASLLPRRAGACVRTR
ncbi:MAG TPA: hypothetical protein VKV80_12690 [Streptosporangiaceae bacterium]|nr:hypothetical protein [Streptosporangiaceae bacterium]